MNAYSFTVDKSALTVAVYDPMIKQFIGHPVVTDLDLRSNGNMIFRWELKNVPTSTGGVRVVYDAFINARTGSNWVEATIPSSPFFVGPRRTGRCGAR